MSNSLTAALAVGLVSLVSFASGAWFQSSRHKSKTSSASTLTKSATQTSAIEQSPAASAPSVAAVVPVAATSASAKPLSAREELEEQADKAARALGIKIPFWVLETDDEEENLEEEKEAEQTDSGDKETKIAPLAKISGTFSNGESFEATKKRLQQYADSKDPYKMVLCVRNDLSMGKGKMCAQCGHAVLGIARKMFKYGVPCESYITQGQPKIALKVNSEEEIISLAKDADKLGLPFYLVMDAGHTQVAPDSLTVLAIGPGPAPVIDKLTRRLKLL